MQIQPNPEIIWLDQTDSTSSEIHRQKENLKGGEVISAKMQTAGRGQGDHKWHSKAGENLTFSIYITYDKPHCLKAIDQQVLTMCSSVAVVHYLRTLGLEAGIKKPNDIYIDRRLKICGMLIENGLKGSDVNWTIVGIGLDMNQTEFPQDLPNPVSVAQLTGKNHELRSALENFMQIYWAQFERIWLDTDALKAEYESLIISVQK